MSPRGERESRGLNTWWEVLVSSWRFPVSFLVHFVSRVRDPWGGIFSLERRKGALQTTLLLISWAPLVPMDVGMEGRKRGLNAPNDGGDMGGTRTGGTVIDGVRREAQMESRMKGEIDYDIKIQAGVMALLMIYRTAVHRLSIHVEHVGG